MTSQEVNTAITTSFAGIYLKQFRYLQGRNDNSITVAENHELNGNGVITLAGSGSLYLKEVPCQESVSGMDDLSVCPETLVPEGPCVPVESGVSRMSSSCASRKWSVLRRSSSCASRKWSVSRISSSSSDAQENTSNHLSTSDLIQKANKMIALLRLRRMLVVCHTLFINTHVAITPLHLQLSIITYFLQKPVTIGTCAEYPEYPSDLGEDEDCNIEVCSE